MGLLTCLRRIAGVKSDRDPRVTLFRKNTRELELGCAVAQLK